MASPAALSLARIVFTLRHGPSGLNHSAFFSAPLSQVKDNTSQKEGYCMASDAYCGLIVHPIIYASRQKGQKAKWIDWNREMIKKRSPR